MANFKAIDLNGQNLARAANVTSEDSLPLSPAGTVFEYLLGDEGLAESVADANGDSVIDVADYIYMALNP